MTMPGGGPWKSAAGQVTDDSELAMSMMNGLVQGEGKLNAIKLCEQYANWYASNPFDIGFTTRDGLVHCKFGEPSRVYTATKVSGATSLSNGALMRCTPLAVWCHNLTREEIIQAVPLDVNFTHNNKASEIVVTTYCLAIQYLLNYPKDTDRRIKAFDIAVDFAAKGCPQVLQWLTDAKTLE